MSAPEMPERIWLIPDIGWDGETAWSNDPAPEPGMDPDNATEYLRADLCASGQQVRALADLVRSHDCPTPKDHSKGRVLWNVIDMPGEYRGQIALTIYEAEQLGHILAALTPAPQPEGQECSRCGSVGGFGCYECTPSAATPTAQEAVSGLRIHMVSSSFEGQEDMPDEPGVLLVGSVDAVNSAARMLGDEVVLYAHPPQPSVSVAEAEIDLLKADIESLTASLAAEVSESEKLRAEIERLTKALTEAANQISDLATRLGRAEGRLVASELVGVVEGWKARAEKAEAERDEARAQVAAAFEAAARRTDSGDVEYPSGVIDMEGEELREILRALTPADAQAALEAYGREKVREGMQRAADIARTPDEDDDQLDRQCRIIVAAQILAAMEKEGEK